MKTLMPLAVLMLFLSGCATMSKPREVTLHATQSEIRAAVLASAPTVLAPPEILIDTKEVLHLRWHSELPDVKRMMEARYEFRASGNFTAVSLGVLKRTETLGDDGKWRANDVLLQDGAYSANLDDLKAKFAN